jgi:hypothetical protein
MSYVTELNRIVEAMKEDPEADQERLARIEWLAKEWFEVAKAVAAVHVMTWRTIAHETYPNFIGINPEAQRLLDLMRHNDVT